ncbi:MAG: hypothetical protein M1821_009377 [Bathelium mastoideum]|nr:MAG: hypothetical protein M1821_009377 [Bathelium mastoideum]
MVPLLHTLINTLLPPPSTKAIDSDTASKSIKSSDAPVEMCPDAIISSHDDSSGGYVRPLASKHEQGDLQIDLHSSSITRGNLFPFLSLPPEIRNRIYSHVLANTKVNNKDAFAVMPGITDGESVFWQNLPVARVSRQLWREFLPILYGSARFSFQGENELCSFLDHIKENRIFIEDLKVNMACGIQSRARMFELLRGCPRLRRITLIELSDNTDEMIQDMLYDQAKSWIYQVALVRNSKRAVLEILRVVRYLISGIPSSAHVYGIVDICEVVVDLDERLGVRLDQDPVLDAWFSVRI